MRRGLVVALLAGQLVWGQTQVRGFTEDQAAVLRDLERKLKAVPDPVRARAYMEKMAAEPHHAGAPATKAVAEYALGLFQQWGYDAKIEVFEALLPFPTARSLEMTAPVKFKAKLAEPVLKEDPDSGDKNQLPLYNAYSASGDVAGLLVYVNYGVPEDYERLKKLGIDVKGKVVIARYGKSWRGTKAKTAQENGAVGCLIYSDPHDDGFFQGDVFPRGPFRPGVSAQRGSVMDMPVMVGDPLSPGWASEPGGKRLKREEAISIMKIPVLPVSWEEAKPLLEQLGGPVAPDSWRGALPLTYHVGPGPANVRMKTDFDWTSKPVYNVVATMTGRELPDEWIIYGNHHDAWVNGASDPVSGAVALLETARAFAELKKQGWTPRRTLKFALWDAEEFGLVGSTEWVEKHRDELQRKAVAYFNSDTNNGGKLGAGGVPMLNTFFREVMRDNVDPQSNRDLLTLAEEDDKKPRFKLSPMGAGSDYVAFLHHAGIASLNIGFNKAGGNGTYHSIYDSVAWFTAHMDSDFQYSRALAQVMGTAMLRMSQAPVLPFEFGTVESTVREWTEELASKKPGDLGAVRQALDGLRAASAIYEAAYIKAQGKATPGQLAEVNRALREAERTLTDPAGLAGRNWYKHTLYAPGLYTGYSARTLPGIREPLDLGRKSEAQAGAGPLAAAIQRLTAKVRQATEALGAI
ncbi:MAG: M28 family metallopeptidase [Bryobacterales bacterium]|nr:M28 family metallopeptidase [Bryobacterales bacterium]